MDRDTRLEPEAERPEGAGPTDPMVGDDTEGHSLSMILGVNAMSRRAVGRRERQGEAEDLKPITKQFPRMREPRKG